MPFTKLLGETENPSPHWLDVPLATSFFVTLLCESAYILSSQNRSWKAPIVIQLQSCKLWFFWNILEKKTSLVKFWFKMKVYTITSNIFT